MALSSTSQGRCYQVLLEAMPLNPLDLLLLLLPHQLTPLPLYKENPQQMKTNETERKKI